MKTDTNEAFTELLRLFLGFEGHPPSNQADEWRCVEDFVTSLAERGWTRKDIYDLVVEIEKVHASSFPEECADAIGNYITALVGQCAVGCIVHFPGDSNDIEEQARYVRGLQWLT